VRRPIYNLYPISFKLLLVAEYFIDLRIILLEYKTRFVVLNKTSFKYIKIGFRNKTLSKARIILFYNYKLYTATNLYSSLNYLRNILNIRLYIYKIVLIYLGIEVEDLIVFRIRLALD